LDAGLRAAGSTTGLIGTIETRIGDEVVPSQRTTPEATELQALLAVMRERGVQAVAMEVSSHALALGRVAGTRFAVSAFTNLSQDHLDFHGDMAAYYAAKAALFTPAYSDAAVITVDDAWGHRLASEADVPVTTTGADVSAAWRRSDEVVALTGGSARLLDPTGGEYALRTRLAGRVNLSNAALAYVTLAVAGVDQAAAGRGIAELPGIPGRMERIEAGQPFGIIVDYAHTPEAVTALLRQLRAVTPRPGRVILVLGCGGDRDRAKRPLMGAAAAAGADLTIFTSDNPRSEDPERIIDEMLAGVTDRDRVVIEPDRAAAITRAVNLARPGDTVTIAGKGHELGQEAAGVTRPFDDRVAARHAAGERTVTSA
jgi:UDP-N-acetylmuramoyl-L-alanyl-D-glutamate--2,6-diaminopimelate ligase